MKKPEMRRKELREEIVEAKNDLTTRTRKAVESGGGEYSPLAGVQIFYDTVIADLVYQLEVLQEKLGIDEEGNRI